jgi:hypothetical protein
MEIAMKTSFPQKCGLRTKAAAAYIGLSPSTLEKSRVSGDGPIYASLGRVVVYDVEDLDAYVDARKRHSTSELTRAEISKSTKSQPRRDDAATQ